MHTEKVFIKRCQKHGERHGEIKGDRNTSSPVADEKPLSNLPQMQFDVD